MAKLDLTDIELKTLDLMIAVKKKSDASRGDFIDDIVDVVDAVATVCEAVCGAEALSGALTEASVPGKGISLEALLQIRRKAGHAAAH